MEEDGVDYLGPVGDRWGELCGSVETANQWVEELMPTLRSCWSDPNPGSYFHGATACLSCLLVMGRYQELLDRWRWIANLSGITAATVSRLCWRWAGNQKP